MAESNDYDEETDSAPRGPAPGSPEGDSSKKYECRIHHKGKYAFSLYTDHFVEFTDQAIDLTPKAKDSDKPSA
jgi:hypothetical protein